MRCIDIHSYNERMRQMNCDLSYCNEIFMPFGSLNYNAALPTLLVFQKMKKERKKKKTE